MSTLPAENHSAPTAPEAASDEARLLARAIGIAARVHETQKDKAGESYILHPLRLVFRAQSWGQRAQMVAALHDVVEDAEPAGTWNADRLRAEGFPSEVIDAVDLLTRRRETTHGFDETYEAFVRRILDATGAGSTLARRIKLLDLEDNMTMTRLKTTLTDKDMARLREYHGAYGRIEEAVRRDG